MKIRVRHCEKCKGEGVVRTMLVANPLQEDQSFLENRGSGDKCENCDGSGHKVSLLMSDMRVWGYLKNAILPILTKNDDKNFKSGGPVSDQAAGEPEPEKPTAS